MSERKKKSVKKTEEEIEDILTESVKEEMSNGEVDVEAVRRKLIELATAGKTQEASEEFTSKYFKKASKADLLYANSIYECHIVKRMQKGIGNCLVATYANMIGRFIDVDDQDSLENDLNADLFLEQALDNLSLRLYEKYGYLFAPASVALITSKHYRNINGERNNGERNKGDSQGGSHAKEGESLKKN